ncbi:MAG: hypothetical protein ABIH00_09215 [Armatimonadota bacterium]
MLSDRLAGQKRKVLHFEDFFLRESAKDKKRKVSDRLLLTSRKKIFSADYLIVKVRSISFYKNNIIIKGRALYDIIIPSKIYYQSESSGKWINILSGCEYDRQTGEFVLTAPYKNCENISFMTSDENDNICCLHLINASDPAFPCSSFAVLISACPSVIKESEPSMVNIYRSAAECRSIEKLAYLKILNAKKITEKFLGLGTDFFVHAVLYNADDHVQAYGADAQDAGIVFIKTLNGAGIHGKDAERNILRAVINKAVLGRYKKSFKFFSYGLSEYIYYTQDNLKGIYHFEKLFEDFRASQDKRARDINLLQWQEIPAYKLCAVSFVMDLIKKSGGGFEAGFFIPENLAQQGVLEYNSEEALNFVRSLIKNSKN